MEKKSIRVILADDNVDFCNNVVRYLTQEEDIDIIKTVHNGIDALEQIKELKPDVAILDGAMPGIDGLGVLERLNDEGNRPVCIMLSSLSHDNITQYAYHLGAEYYIIKPFEMSILAHRIRMFCGSRTPSHQTFDMRAIPKFGNDNNFNNDSEESSDIKLQKYISTILYDIGVPTHIRGNHYTRVAITMVVKKPEILYYITKELYPSVAKECKTTPASVERSIRNAIDIVWTRGKKEGLEKHFGSSFSDAENKPSNGEFIAFIADKLRMEQFK